MEEFNLNVPYELYSCSCLYAECALSKYENENFQQLHCRISRSSQDNWLVRTSYAGEKRYVSCFNHCKRILENVVISATQNTILTENCFNKDPENSDHDYMNCFRFFFEEDMNLKLFCRSCKRHLIGRTPDTFLLHRVIVNNGEENES